MQATTRNRHSLLFFLSAIHVFALLIPLGNTVKAIGAQPPSPCPYKIKLPLSAAEIICGTSVGMSLPDQPSQVKTYIAMCACKFGEPGQPKCPEQKPILAEKCVYDIKPNAFFLEDSGDGNFCTTANRGGNIHNRLMEQCRKKCISSVHGLVDPADTYICR